MKATSAPVKQITIGETEIVSDQQAFDLTTFYVLRVKKKFSFSFSAIVSIFTIPKFYEVNKVCELH